MSPKSYFRFSKNDKISMQIILPVLLFSPPPYHEPNLIFRNEAAADTLLRSNLWRILRHPIRTFSSIIFRRFGLFALWNLLIAFLFGSIRGGLLIGYFLLPPWAGNGERAVSLFADGSENGQGICLIRGILVGTLYLVFFYVLSNTKSVPNWKIKL